MGGFHRTPPSSKNMRTTKEKPGIRPTPLHYLTGMLALAFVCCSLLYIYLYTAPAHANSRSQQANGQAMSGQLAFAETETETPPPTVTNTPSPTTTATPIPSPSVTRTTTPSPTPTRSATVQPSATATGMQTPSPGATPTSSATSITISVQETGANQPPVASPAPTHNQSDQASQGAHRPGNPFPFSALMIGLGSVALLGLLLILGWMIVRRCLLPVSLPKFPASGAASWSRTRISDQEEQAIQDGALSQTSAFSLQGHATYNAPSARTTPAIPVSRPGSLFAPGSTPPDNLNALPTMADVPIPNQPAFSSREHAAPAAASPASHTNPSAGIGQSFDSSYLAARIRQRQNELRAAEGLPAFQKQTPGELSADIAELNDPYLQSLIRLSSERGRAVRPSPREST